MKVNSGQDKEALALAGGTQAGVVITGTITYTATSIGGASVTGLTASALVGKFAVAGTVYGVITANTTTSITVDRWYNPASPTGAAGTTPAANTSFVVLGGAAPVFYMALTANSTAPAATDTSLTAEITTASGGLIRQAVAYAHTAGANTYTLTGTYTANGSDSLPVTIAKMGTFDCLTGAAGVMLHESLVSPTATLSASGDQLTVTQTVTM